MLKNYVSILLTAALLLTAAPSAAGGGLLQASTSKFDFAKKKKAGIHAPSEAGMNAYRTEYFQKAARLSEEGRNLEACAVVQKLIDRLLKKSGGATADEWLESYAPLYKEAIGLRNSYRAKAESFWRAPFEKSYRRASKDRLSGNVAMDEPREAPCHGSLSPDQTVCLYSGKSGVGSHAISALTLKGDKLWEEIPVPDDKKNPQIKRWGKAATIKSPKWSPDGKRYAFILNGALCVASSGGRKELVSGIRDSSEENDVSFDWSADGLGLIYVRDRRGSRTAHYCPAGGGPESSLGAADWAAISPDGSRAATSLGDEITVKSARGGKAELSAKGRRPVFTPDGKGLLYVGSDGSLKRRAIRGKSEETLWSPPKGREITSVSPVNMSLTAATLSDGDLYIISGKGSARRAASKAGKIDLSFMNSVNGVLCENKITRLRSL